MVKSTSGFSNPRIGRSSTRSVKRPRSMMASAETTNATKKFPVSVISMIPMYAPTR